GGARCAARQSRQGRVGSRGAEHAVDARSGIIAHREWFDPLTDRIELAAFQNVSSFGSSGGFICGWNRPKNVTLTPNRIHIPRASHPWRRPHLDKKTSTGGSGWEAW